MSSKDKDNGPPEAKPEAPEPGPEAKAGPWTGKADAAASDEPGADAGRDGVIAKSEARKDEPADETPAPPDDAAAKPARRWLPRAIAGAVVVAAIAIAVYALWPRIAPLVAPDRSDPPGELALDQGDSGFIEPPPLPGTAGEASPDQAPMDEPVTADLPPPPAGQHASDEPAGPDEPPLAGDAGAGEPVVAAATDEDERATPETADVGVDAVVESDAVEDGSLVGEPPADDPLAGEAIVSADPRVDALLSRLDALDARLSGLDALDALAARLEAVEAGVADRPAAPIDDTAHDAALEAALGGLADRLAAIERAVAASPDLAGTMLRIERRLGALEIDPERERLGAALRQWHAQREALEGTLAALDARIAALAADAARQSADDGRLAAVVFASGELTSATRTARAFSAELEALRALVGNDPLLQPVFTALTPLADSGIATPDGLSARFDATASAVARASLEAESGDWEDETLAALRKLVTVRRTGGAGDAESVDGRMIAARKALDAGDLAGAVALVKTLPEPAAGGAADWLAAAEARLAADAALRRLADRVNGIVRARWSGTAIEPGQGQ